MNYHDPKFWDLYRNTPAWEFARFLTLCDRGKPTLEPRMTALPVRLPLPPAAREGSIYENQTGATRSYFKKAATQ